jgi:hypothetical protein
MRWVQIALRHIDLIAGRYATRFERDPRIGCRYRKRSIAILLAFGRGRIGAFSA